jgi:hypothetical protein
MKLRAIAHSRAGDKGRIVNLSLIAFNESDYPRLARVVTAQRVKDHLGAIVSGSVVRYELPAMSALNFVIQRAPRESVTRTLALDAHGKSLSSALLEMEIGNDE